MTALPVLLLSNQDLIGLLPPLQVIAAAEAAACAQEAAVHVLPPKRMHAQWAGNSLFMMPAAVQGSLGVKVFSVVPGNTARGLPSMHGVMLLHDGETGLPFAMLNAAALTVQRAGAVSALGLMHLTPQKTSSVGIVGCGPQAIWLTIFACAVRPIVDVFVLSRSDAGFQEFVANVTRHAPAVNISACYDTRELLASTDVVMTATSSVDPILPDEPHLLANKHFVSIGSYRPTMQELPNSVYRLSCSLAIDSLDACYDIGDVINPLRSGILNRTDIFSIAECVTGQRKPDTARTTVFKVTGAAIYDLFAAQAFYRAARLQGIGCEVPF